MNTPPIIACSLNQWDDHVVMFGRSCLHYATDSHLGISAPRLGSFGADYNFAMRFAFDEYPQHERFIIANDDVILRPDTMRLLIEDADELDRQGYTWGHIACRSDRVARGAQNVMQNPLDEAPKVFAVDAIAPLFSMINRKTWVDFPPINWGSDVIQCLDMRAKDAECFVSRAYVHHIGGITTGERAAADRQASVDWCLQNRPELAKFI
jgi:hypothetical protein